MIIEPESKPGCLIREDGFEPRTFFEWLLNKPARQKIERYHDWECTVDERYATLYCGVMGKMHFACRKCGATKIEEL